MVKGRSAGEFQVEYLNYVFDSKELEPVEWEIRDIRNETWRINPEGVSRSIHGDSLKVDPRIFLSGREYEVSARVRRADYTFAEGVASYQFKTGIDPPIGGNVSMFPINGLFGKTDFSFTVSNWVSPSTNSTIEVFFRLYGKQQDRVITLT